MQEREMAAQNEELHGSQSSGLKYFDVEEADFERGRRACTGWKQRGSLSHRIVSLDISTYVPTYNEK